MIPLAERMRPKDLDHYIGQDHIVGPGTVIRNAIKKGQVHSFIMWGPPGVGKTTLAKIIANAFNRPFFELSAINAGVKDIREAISSAKRQQFFDTPSPVLFIDEIHRFSKSQQDALLGAVEQGIVTLIGATTENPSFEVISALLSRCQVYVLEPLTFDQLKQIIDLAVQEDESLSRKDIKVFEYDMLIRYSGGDARKLLNALEIVVASAESDAAVEITNEMVEEVIQQNLVMYDKSGEQHYDMASAFIKSIRGSDPNAAVYWLARMIEGGEDEKFICRRMIISASEDIGLANPNALLMANQCMSAVQAVGFPEARIILSQTAIYLATSQKSNSAYMAINEAQNQVRNTGNLPVPLHLRNAPTKLMKQLDYGKNYKYAHDFDQNFTDQNYLPKNIEGLKFYDPQSNASEDKIRGRLRNQWGKRYGY